MQPENMSLRLDIGKRELYLAIDTPWPDEGWIERVDAVGSQDNLDITACIEAVELIEELKHRSLDFTLTTWCRIVSNNVEQSGILIIFLTYRLVPIASISSMNTILGAWSSAARNSSRTSLGPSPRYFWINSDPTTRRKVADVWFATALARSVFPVPGTP